MSCDWGQDPVVVSIGLGNSPSGCIKTGKFLLVAERLFSSLILLLIQLCVALLAALSSFSAP